MIIINNKNFILKDDRLRAIEDFRITYALRGREGEFSYKKTIDSYEDRIYFVEGFSAGDFSISYLLIPLKGDLIDKYMSIYIHGFKENLRLESIELIRKNYLKEFNKHIKVNRDKIRIAYDSLSAEYFFAVEFSLI